MAKQLNVSLAMTADTSKAKAQLQDLQRQLTAIINGATVNKSNFALTDEIKEASIAAAQLKAQLEGATNVNTGKLDLGKFSQAMKKSNMSLKEYQKQLHNLGPIGDQAFASLAKSVMSAEVPLRRSNALISEMWTTMQNTARWQLSSSVLHGFMGALQSAYGYAQDLNKSLNDIRIVTGLSTDTMDKFAEKANKAAKALSTTTTEYTNAALIYYQQGLNDDQVTERTNVTIKLANAAGISAETASEQLTAIWNNFDDGSESLEHYADVLVKLGAETASSSDEISEGLQKFAAIGSTIGLSYENAAAALATVTATTRQSADVVGTAFKTIFARIQGLNLGETLEDGTTLNKYSEALMRVGISIKDQSGELKDMDTILAEMGNKWGTLNKDQQVALAQTVAGVRQYNQLMALMDNYDFYEKNLASAQGADGALNVQADIYAQSWEASRDRVQAAAEDIYDSLLNDDFFIDLNNGFADFLSGLGEVIDGMGGLKGILLMVGSIAMNVFNKQINQGLENMAYNVRMLTKNGRAKVTAERDKANNLLVNNSADDGTTEGGAKADAYKAQGQLQGAYLKAAEKMSEEQRKISQALLDQQQIMIKNVELAGQEVSKAEANLALTERKNLQGVDDSHIDRVKQAQSAYAEMVKNATQYKTALEQIGGVKINSTNLKDQQKNLQAWVLSLKKSGVDIEKSFGIKAQKAFEDFEKSVNDSSIEAKDLEKALDKLYASIQGSDLSEDEFEKLAKEMAKAGLTGEQIKERMDAIRQSAEKLGQEEQELAQKTSILSNYTEQVSKNFEEFRATASVGQVFTSVASSIGSVVSIVNTLKSTWDTLNSSDVTFGEKIMAVMSGLAMVIPTVITLLNAENIALLKTGASWLKDTTLKAGNAMASGAVAIATKILTVTKGAETGAVVANTAAWYANPIMWIVGVIMLVVAAIAALVVAFADANKIETENCETLIENAEKTKELANANNELKDTMEDLISSYEEMNAAGEDTTEVLNDIKNNIPSLINSYRELAESMGMPIDKIEELHNAANLAVITGNFDDFNAKKAEIDKELVKSTAETSKNSSIASSKLLGAGMQNIQGSVSGNIYTLDVGGVSTMGNSALGTTEEQKAQSALINKMGGYAKKSDDLFKHGVELSADYSSPTEFVDYYEKMVAARDEMLATMSAEELNRSDIFREVNEVIQGTAEQYQTAKEQADEYIAVAGDALEAELGDGSNIQSMQDYLAYRKEYINLATTQYGLTQEQAEAYLEESAGLSEVAQQYQLATIMAEKFGNIDTSNANFQAVSDDFYNMMSAAYGDLSDQELQVAISLAASSDSIEEFSSQFQHSMIEATRQGYANSAEIARQAMQSAVENGSFDMSGLLGDDNFIKYLEEIGVSQVALTSKTYEEQYAIVNEYYSKINTDMFDSFSAQQELYYQQIADTQNELSNFRKTMSGENAEAARTDQATYADLERQIAEATDPTTIQNLTQELNNLAMQFQQDYGFEITSNAASIQSEIDKMLESIQQLQDQKIEMAMDWSGVDELEASMKQAASFAKTITKDTKKVGDSYELTAAQAREWLEFYPELGEIAETTNEGIIKMNAAEVDAFIEGKDEELDTSIDAKIRELESQKAVLQTELDLKQKDLEAANALAEGKMNLEEVSAQYLVDLRSNLTDYFIQCGMDEQAAQAAALETMGMNEETYSQAVADACETNATNMTYAAQDGANAQVDALDQMVERWKNFGTYLINNIGTILRDIGAAILDPNKSVSDVMMGAWNASAITLNTDGSHSYESSDGSYEFNAGDETQRKAVYEAASRGQLDDVNAAMEELRKGISSLDGQIDYLEALKNQDLSDYGSEDADDVKGSGDGDSKDKDEKDLVDIAERYHEITREIEMQEKILDRLGKAKDMAYGRDKIKLMDQELKELDKLIEKEEELFELQTAYLAIDRKNIDDNFTTEVQYDENGNISNYSDLLKEAEDKINAARKTFNDSAQEQADKDALDAAEKEYEKQLELLSQYEETLDEWWEQRDNLTDKEIEKLNLKLAKTQYAVEMKVDVENDSLEYLNYLIDNLDDNAHDAAEAITLLGQSAQASMNKVEAYKKGLSDIFANHGLSQETMEKFLSGDPAAMEEVSSMSFTEDEIAAMREYKNAIMEENQTLMDLRDTVHEKVLTAFQDLTAEMDTEIAKIDQLKSVTQSYQNIIDIVGQEYLGISDELMSQIDQATVDMSVDKLSASKAKLDAMQESRKKAEEELQKARESGSEESVKKWEENLAEIDGMIQEAESEFMSSWEEAVQAAADVFEKETTRVVENFTDAMAGEAGSLAKLQDEFDKQKAASERYLADYKQSYELAKLSRDISNSISDTDNLKAKEDYKELIEEIEAIEAEGRKMSEYELQNLQKRYELKQAELALEEAKNSKSQVRMTRDNEGNWGYVYTADEDKVSQALQNYEDKAYAIQEAADQYSQQMQASAIEVAQKIADEIQNIQAAYGTEEWFEEVQRITAYYEEEFGYYSDQLGLALDDLGISFGDTAYGAITGFQSMDEAQDLLNQSIGAPGQEGTLLGDLDKAYQTWKTNTEAAMNAAGTSTDGFAGKVETATETAVNKSAEAREAVNAMGDDMVTIMDDVMDSVSQWEADYGNKIDSMISKNDDLIASYNALLAKQSEVSGSDGSGGGGSSDGGSGGDSGGGDSGGGSGDGGSGGGGAGSGSDKIEGVAAAIWMDGSDKSGWGTGDTRKARLSEKGVSAAQEYINAHSGEIYANWSKKRDQLKNFYYGSFDTGGYTGSWGPEGRLALLHQKELVLNAHDTENMLKMVEYARDISNMIDVNAMSFSRGLDSMLHSTGRIGGMTDNVIQQEITIHAEFPDATNHNEIEEAFNNLLNTASQYANRNF